MSSKKIFISHSQDDNNIASAFISLLASLGIDQSFFSSSPHSLLTNEKNIYQYLKEETKNNLYVFYFLSEHYYASHACLNEMGAFWVTTKPGHDSAILIDDYDFPNNQGAIDPKPIAIKLAQLDCLEKLATLITNLYTYLELDKHGISKEDYQKIADFLKQFASITEDTEGYLYSPVLETRSTDYWPEAQFLKIEKNVSQKKIEDTLSCDNESHWLVYLDGTDFPISVNDYVKFKVTGKSKLYKQTNERNIYISDIFVL